MLYQHRWWLHSQLKDQDSELQFQPYVAIIQVELFPNASDISDLRRYQDYRIWRQHTQSSSIKQSQRSAYVNEVVKQHWELARAFATGLRCEVLVPLYGLAPDHHAEEALAFTTALLDDLAGGGRAVYVSGDSAGGGLALYTKTWLDACIILALLHQSSLCVWNTNAH